MEHESKRALWLWLTVLLLAVNLPLLAQETTGNIVGKITDPTGAVIPGTAVMVTNLETGTTFRTETGAAGNYQARDLSPGRYSAVFQSTGFSRTEIPNIIVLVGKTVQINATLEVGQVEQTVQVVEAAPLIDTTSTMISHNIPVEEINSLPKGRGFEGVSILSPSVNTGTIEQGYQINGASAAENNYYIDGVSTTSLIDGSARQTAVFEHLQEVQVKTGSIEAEYGGALGGVVSAVTKSGGNDFHGEVHYYYFGNSIAAGPANRLNLDPRDELTVRYVQDEKQSSNNHEAGGSIGGPFIKNKLWFFSSFSPRFLRRSYDYKLTDGQDTVESKTNYMSLFNKLSFNPTDRIRTNFSWLYSPTDRTGALYAYNDVEPNTRTSDVAFMQSAKNLGFFQPEQSYSGSVDIMLTNTSLLNIKGGRYYLNYKDTGVDADAEWRWITASEHMENIPEEYRQPRNFWTTSAAKILFDITARTYVQADYSQFLNAGGQHNIKAGIGTQKNVNKVNDAWVGPGGRVNVYWDTDYNGERGTYGYYRVYDAGTIGSSGAHITHIYFQDQWRVHPRLTLNLGLRMEKETIPSFQRSIQDYAFQFGFGDKLAPRLGGSFDVLGDGRIKVYGSWGRYYDWTKYDLARGTFGGDIWRDYYRTLDTYDVYSITLDNMPGRNLWNGDFRNWRVPGFDLLDPNVKPMSTDLINAGVEYEIRPQTVFAARYVRNKLNRTIEDFGALDAEGNEVYRYGNPGEGLYEIGPVSGATCEIETGGVCGMYMPRAERYYNALELSLTRRFSKGWMANASYVYSRLRGNYAGLQSSDEIRPTGGSTFSPNQGFSGLTARPGGNANRYFDLDEAMFDANGNRGPFGPLATDRPHVFKFYGAKHFSFGTQVGGFFRVMSGTPASTQVWTVNHIPVLVNGRGDMGRTPVFSQTDLMVAHEFSVGEGKRLRLEFNLDNLFNQKTSQFLFDRLNSEDRGNSAAIDLSGVDLTQGFNYQALLEQTDDWASGLTLEPRYGRQDLFNPGFQGRFLIKFIF